MMDVSYRILGNPATADILIIGDHAAKDVPSGLDLGLPANAFEEHVAWDIGVAAVAELVVKKPNFAAFLGKYSRLVVDLNRYADEEAVIALQSDGYDIPGNRLTPAARDERLARYYQPYHDRLTQVLRDHQPALILSLHSFTPQLKSADVERPWEISVLYNEQERPSRLAISYLETLGLHVGDQLPYSGKLLNATMNRHAEANEIPYVGIEMRQDLVSNAEGQERFAQILTNMCHFVSERLGIAA
jgi:predicted N-formylglutamate amidohydrolase